MAKHRRNPRPGRVQLVACTECGRAILPDETPLVLQDESGPFAFGHRDCLAPLMAHMVTDHGAAFEAADRMTGPGPTEGHPAAG
jgi:hypothetical protein